MSHIGSMPLPQTAFSEYLLRCNGLDKTGFDSWIFYPGMLFGAEARWWGKRGHRDRRHEGLDLCLYRDKAGRIHSLNRKTKIPVMFEGEVVKIHDDFLGKSIYIAHHIYDSSGNQLCTIYGHTEPYGEVASGGLLGEGDLIATVADASKRRAEIPSHLHISVAWVPQSLSRESLNWETISRTGEVTLQNPLEVIACRYAVVTPA